MKVNAADTIIEVRGKKIGAKKGHVSSRRAKPVHIDRHEEHSLKIYHSGPKNAPASSSTFLKALALRQLSIRLVAVGVLSAKE